MVTAPLTLRYRNSDWSNLWIEESTADSVVACQSTPHRVTLPNGWADSTCGVKGKEVRERRRSRERWANSNPERERERARAREDDKDEGSARECYLGQWPSTNDQMMPKPRHSGRSPVDPRRCGVAARRAFVLGLVQDGRAFGLVISDVHGQRLVELGLATGGRVSQRANIRI